MKLKQFSLDDYLSRWSHEKEDVRIEGTLLEDGDYYVIDQDPSCVSPLIYVKKEDVSEIRESRIVSSGREEHKLYFMYIRRGVPVQIRATRDSDSLVLGRETFGILPNEVLFSTGRGTTITATFRNSSIFNTHWVIADYYAQKELVNRLFVPDEKVTVTLLAPSGYGYALYGRYMNPWTHKSLISNGDQIDMY